MPDVFISYAQTDRAAALATQAALRDGGVSVFLAENSIEPGAQWPAELDRAIRSADLVLVLASRAACQSTWVQHEVGIAVGARRKILPIVWDMPPSELPGVLANMQALNLAGRTPETVQQEFEAICKRLRADWVRGLTAAGLFVYVLTKLG
jgi:hypothetical protein